MDDNSTRLQAPLITGQPPLLPDISIETDDDRFTVYHYAVSLFHLVLAMTSVFPDALGVGVSRSAMIGGLTAFDKVLTTPLLLTYTYDTIIF